MKTLVITILLMMIIKGFIYIFFPLRVRWVSQKLADIEPTQLIIYGILLWTVSLVVWLSWARYLP